MRSFLYLCLALAIGAPVALFSQSHQHTHDHPHREFRDPGHVTCWKEEMTNKFFEDHPEELAPALEARQQQEQFTRDFAESGDRSTTLVIPVVFHVIHANGVENISNAQVLSAIDVLNEDFSANTPNIQNVVSAFTDVVGNVEVEFRLARKDPQGNCTNGIVRVVNQATFSGGTNLANISAIWPRNRYLNIYVCAEIGNGIAGFTFIPSDVNGASGAGIDAIYITHPYVGRVGTGNSTRSHALTHEVGHWLNLEHTWGVTNQPGVATNCNQDDFVADTPNCIGWTTCNLSGSTCGSLDNVENFMDYAYCYKMFTAGQALRMRAALNSSLGQRNQLHVNSNLTFTGVNLPEVICEADFAVTSDPSICQGMTVSFEDVSYNGVTTRAWSFPGGTPASSNLASPTVTYNQSGAYDVTLTVSNPQGGLTVTRTSVINVLPVGENGIPYEESFEGFNSLHLTNNWYAFDPDGNDVRSWELYTGAGYTGNKSVYVQGRFNPDGAVEMLDSPTYDLSSVSSNAVFSFKYAHARRSAQSDDRLRIWISRDCGNTWSLRRTINMADLPTVSQNVSGGFVPSGQADWAEVTISNIVSVFLNPEFRVRIEFNSFRGNNIYIDDLNLYDPLTLSTSTESMAAEVKVYPNPTADFTSLEYTLLRNSRVVAEVIDLRGSVVDVLFNADRAAGTYTQQYDVNHLAPGMYLIRLTANGEASVHKLMVK